MNKCDNLKELHIIGEKSYERKCFRVPVKRKDRQF